MIEYDEMIFCDDCKEVVPHRMDAALFPNGHTEIFLCLVCEGEDICQTCNHPHEKNLRRKWQMVRELRTVLMGECEMAQKILKWLFCFGCMMSHYHELQESGKYRCPNCHHERDE